jgi:uncharacterized protein
LTREVKPEIEVRDNPGEARYEIRADGTLAGFATYSLHDGRITFMHTEIDESHSHHGLGTALAHAALDDAAARGLSVVPRCQFVAAVIRQDPARYLDLVAPGMRRLLMRDDGAGSSA